MSLECISARLSRKIRYSSAYRSDPALLLRDWRSEGQAGIELADAGQLGELVLQRHQVAGANRVDVLGVVGDQVYVRVDLAVDGLPGGPPA